MSSYVTKYNNSSITGTNLDIGTLFCDNSYNQTLGGNKTFTGTVYVPTPATDASRTEVVTAAWIRTGYAPINSPTFTGTPLAPTPATDASRTELVNAAWIRTGYAPINSPTFTGTPRAPTPVSDASRTELVTAAWTKNYTFIYPCYRVLMTYTNSGKQYVKYSDSGASIQFNYGIYMCTMMGLNTGVIENASNPDYQSGRRELMNVEWTRLSESYDGGYSRLSIPIGDGSKSKLHFEQYGDGDNRRYMGITGTIDENVSVLLYLIIQRIG
jgi:hypothetical protein